MRTNTISSYCCHPRAGLVVEKLVCVSYSMLHSELLSATLVITNAIRGWVCGKTSVRLVAQYAATHNVSSYHCPLGSLVVEKLVSDLSYSMLHSELLLQC